MYRKKKNSLFYRNLSLSRESSTDVQLLQKRNVSRSGKSIGIYNKISFELYTITKSVRLSSETAETNKCLKFKESFLKKLFILPVVWKTKTKKKKINK